MIKISFVIKLLLCSFGLLGVILFFLVILFVDCFNFVFVNLRGFED